jgi:hypothetical protein
MLTVRDILENFQRLDMETWAPKSQRYVQERKTKAHDYE